MLLRRITEHVKAQNWTAVGLDFVIVVVGVFIGIQVANWNDARLSDQKEIEYLHRLREDIIRSRLALSEDLAGAEQQYNDQSLIADALQQCTLSTDRENDFNRGLRWLGKFNPPRLDSRTIDEMTSTGELYLIDSAAIKELLSEIVSDIQLRSGVTETIYRRIEPHILKVESYLLYDIPEAPIVAGFEGSKIDTLEISFDFSEMCQDQSVVRAVSAISAMTYSRAATFYPLITKLEQLEFLITEQLKDAEFHQKQSNMDMN